MNERGTVTIPKEARGGVGGLYEVVRRDDGVIELRPKIAVDASQAWFWTERWQAMEREADEDYAAGRYKTFDDVERFLDDLDASVANHSSI
jgi:bifunctional DNA-binding transcriptional regulator/antitoxin component of YhaV-PrlF toxin-antitoxin module